MPKYDCRDGSEKLQLRHLQRRMCAHAIEKAMLGRAATPTLASCIDFQSRSASPCKTQDAFLITMIHPVKSIALD